MAWRQVEYVGYGIGEARKDVDWEQIWSKWVYIGIKMDAMFAVLVFRVFFSF